jgi:hypothetical protein
MRSEAFPLDYVDVMIDFLENKIETNTLTPALLEGMQRRLDEIDAAHRDDPRFDEFYPHMLELQTLIFGESGDEDKAMHFMKEAVRQSGGVGKLRSRLLRVYIANQHARRAADESKSAAIESSAEEQFAEADPIEAGFEHMQELKPQDDYSTADYRKHASEVHMQKKPRFRAVKVGFAIVFGLAVISAATLHFVPQAAALPILLAKHSQITDAKQNFNNLTAQYNACSSKLATEHNAIDTNDHAAVDAYNQATKDCQAVLQQQNQAADMYNALIGEQY